jgi:diguanylate cyclase (GGDEF)-like protein
LARAAALAYALFGLVALAPDIFNDPRTAHLRPLGAIGFVGLIVALVSTFLRRRLFIGEPVVVPVLMVLAGAPLADPYTAIVVAERIVPPQSLYGSVASTVVRTTLLVVGLPVVVAEYPGLAGYHWDYATLLAVVPGVILLAALMWVLRVAVLRETKASAELAYRAGHDTVTDLFNRREFLNRMEQDQHAGRARQGAVIGMDLDNFKQVNDEFGHQAGDDVLRAVAHRLSDVLGAAPYIYGYAARLGGDEFAVLVSAGDRCHVDDVARRIHARLQEPIMVGGKAAPIGVSLGVAYETDETTATQLLDHADVAMYRAKQTGKNRIETYSPHDEDQSSGGLPEPGRR